MLRFNKKIWSFLLIIGAILVSLISVLTHMDNIMLAFINAVGVIGLIYLGVGIIILIYQGGFFRGISYGFKRFFIVISDKYGDLRPEDSGKPPEPLSNIRHPSIIPLILIGLLLFALSLLLSYQFFA